MIFRSVFDTNTLASGAVAPGGGTLGTLVETWQRGRIRVVLSPEILAELQRALAKPYFVRRLSAADIAAYQEMVRVTAEIVPITAPVPSVVRSRADNLVLATAESGDAAFVVTGDHELQRLGAYRAIRILSPADFLTVLRAEGIVA